MGTKAEDEVAYLISANNHDDVIFFTNKGKAYHIRAFDIPEGSRISKGQAVINLISIESNEKVKSVIAIPNIAEAKGHLIIATKRGMIKKTELNKFAKIKTNGLLGIKLDGNDKLITVKTTSGNDEIFIVTYHGKAIRFSENDVRPMGRATKGVKGITLKKEDYVVTMETYPAQDEKPQDGRKRWFRDLIVATEKGIGKRTAVKLFPLHKRSGVGVKIAKLTERTGNIAAAAVVTPEVEQIMLITKKAQMIKLPLKNIKQLGRNTQGIILMRFAKAGDYVAAMTCLKSTEDVDSGESETKKDKQENPLKTT
jgi:DNA gyrase subunit A